MKRTLSLVLVLCMLITLLPTFSVSFAAEPTEFVVDFSEQDLTKLTVSGGKYYLVSGGTAEGSNWSINSNKQKSTILKSNNRVKFLGTAMQILFSVNDTTGGKDSLIMNFKVPNECKYDITANAYYSADSGKADFYIDGKLVGSEDFGTNDKSAYKDGDIATGIMLSGGSHELKIVAKKSLHETKAYITLKKFTFTPVGGLETVELECDKNYMLVSDTKGMRLFLTAHYSGGEAVDIEKDAEVEFISSDKEKAIVSDDGIITPVSEGNVKITANVTVAGVTKSAEITIAILNTLAFDAENFNVDFSEQDLNQLTLYERDQRYYLLSGGTAEGSNWSINSDKTKSTVLKSNYRVKFLGTAMQILFSVSDTTGGSNSLVLNFTVPEDGIYDVFANAYYSKDCGKGEFYVDGKLIGSPDFYSESALYDDGQISSDAVYLTKGTHELKMVSRKSVSEEKAYITMKRLMFVPRGSINTVELESERKYILISDADGEKLTVSGTYESGVAVDIENDAAVKFTSSDESVATVSPDGSVIPVSLGKVTITAEVTVDGIAKSAGLDLTVSETPIYDDFTVDFKNQTAATAYEATIATNGWEINKEKTDKYLYSTASKNNQDITRYQSYGLQIQSTYLDDRRKITFNFNVPSTGAYNIEMQGANNTSGGIGYIYINGKYVGEYNFYGTMFNASPDKVSLRPLVLEKGKNELTFVAMENGASSRNMYPTTVSFYGTSELSPISEVGAEMNRTSIAAGESEKFALYVLQQNGARWFPKPMLTGDEDVSLSVVSADSEIAQVDGSFVKAKKPGAARMLITGSVDENQVSGEFAFTVNDSTYSHADIDVVHELFYEGGTTEISATAVLSDGTHVEQRDVTYYFTSDNDDVAMVNGNVLSTVSEGEATITAYVTFNGEEKSAETKIKVVPVALASISAKTEDTVVSATNETGSKIIVTGTNNDGSANTLEGASFTYESLTPDIVSIRVDGDAAYVVSESRGTGKIKVTADVGGVEFSCEAEITSSSQKTEPTVYTYEMRENALDNISKYDWAKSAQKEAVAAADYWVENLDALYNMIMYEGIPRSFVPALMDDPDAYDCAYCGEDIREKHNSYAWGMDPLSRPFKIQCPNCKRLFPSNEFDKFYKLGLDEKGQFDRMRALEKHREMFADTESSPAAPGEEWSDDWCAYYGYGKGYLKNELYKDVDTTLGVETDKVSTWAVDDGWGWDTGKDASSGIPIKKAFIACYNHNLWHPNIDNYITDAVDALREAYLYTGNIKYGRAGAIIVDRIADVYPSMDLNQYPAYQNSHGGRNTGKILGSIWETDIATCIVRGYDAFYPAMDDPKVIEYLSAKAEEFNLPNPKLTGDMIRENCENGILREVYKGATSERICGNFGMHQLAVSLAAIALDTFPETAQMLDWVGARSTHKSGSTTQYGKVYSMRTSNSGGEVLTKFVNDVDRDGFGNEIGVGYNQSWLTNSIKIAEALYQYGKYDGLDLYGNAKYRKMFDAIIHMTMAGNYTLQLGDTATTASTNNMTSASASLLGFKRLGDPKYAQIVYLLKNGDLSGTYIDIFTKNAEDIQDEIEAVIDEYGEYEFESRNLTGFGLAVLSGGELISGAGSGTDVRRDTWLWYGDTTASHGHNDMLQMGIDAYGFNFTPDLGYPAATSYDPNRLQWIATTLSHNTVVVNGKSQGDVKNGTPLHYDDAGMVKVIDAEAPGVYDETDIYRRTLVSVDASAEVAYTVDFFRVRGGDEHIYSFHTQSADGVTADGLNLVPQVDENGEYTGTYVGKDVYYTYTDPETGETEERLLEYGKDPDTKEAWTYETRYPRGYTWLKNVRRDENLTDGSFSINFKQTDFKKQVANASGLNLKFTALNDWTPSSVGIAVAEPPRRNENRMIPYLDYMLIHNKGKDLDTLFTSVIQPYKGEEYIESMESIALTNSGGEKDGDTSKAVKVTLKSGRTDYIVYATNSDVIYTLTDGNVSFDFSGFVGVYSVNSDGDNIYAYVNDGGKIGNLTANARYTGSVVEFTEDLVSKNTITVKLNEEISEKDALALAGRYVYIDNTGNLNGAYKIKSAALSGENVVLDIGEITLIKSYKNSADLSKGYVYNIAKDQTIVIPLSASEDYAPTFSSVPQNLTTSAGSSVSVTLSAESPKGESVTYVGKILPRGASVNAETGVVTWKPDSSQIGENGFMITACDESGRESSVTFEVTVYGSTTGASSNSTDNSSTDNSSTTGAGGGGGGGGGTTDSSASENTDASDETDNGASSGEGGNVRFIDLGNHSWAADAINSLAADGIVKGTTATTYSPAANITRADFALLLVRAFNLESDNAENFADVSASDYFAPELAVARNTGIINGIGDNKYAPRNPITRQDMMVIVYRAIKPSLPKGSEAKRNVDAAMNDSPVDYQNRGVTEPGEKGTAEWRWEDSADSTTSDEALLSKRYGDWDSVAPYARDAVSYLIANGIVNGKSGLIAPLEYTTRAEIAVLLGRVLDYIK